ncbi:MAG TPA: lysylphosphatidylglycerol synthase transmembrane domain-containing protein [Longimicrobiales bacterium]
MEPHVRDAADDLSATLKPPTGRAARAFRIALIALPLGVIGNIAYTLLATDRALLASIDRLPRAYLLAALALTLVPWLTGTARLLVWSRFLGHRIPLRQLLRMTLVVDLGSAVSPTAIGGEAFRWGMLVRHGVSHGAAATLALMPKLEDAVFFALALPLAVIWTSAWQLPVVASSLRIIGDNVLTIAAILLLIAASAWLLSHGALRGHAGQRIRDVTLRLAGRVRRRLRRAALDARAAFALIAAGGGSRFALTLTLTAAHWVARYSVVSALALFLGAPFDPVLFWLLQWVVFTIMTFIPTPGATGGAELAFTAVYATLLPPGIIGLATAAWRLFTFYVPVGLAAAGFALLGRPVR